MNKTNTTILILVLLFLLSGGLAFFLLRKKKEPFPPMPGGKNKDGTDSQGKKTKILSDLPGLSAVPETARTLINRRKKSKRLMIAKKKGNEWTFEPSEITIAPHQAFGMFNPKKEDPDFPVTIEWNAPERTYTMLRVKKNGKYYYVPLDNVAAGNPTQGQTQGQTQEEKTIEETVSRLYALLDGYTSGDEEKKIVEIIMNLSDEDLRKVTEAFNRKTRELGEEDLLSWLYFEARHSFSNPEELGKAFKRVYELTE